MSPRGNAGRGKRGGQGCEGWVWLFVCEFEFGMALRKATVGFKTSSVVSYLVVAFVLLVFAFLVSTFGIANRSVVGGRVVTDGIASVKVDDDDWDVRLGKTLDGINEEDFVYEGDCAAFKQDGNKRYLFVTGHAEQTFSSLAGVLNGLRASAADGRAYVGPFIRRTHNAVSSYSTLRKDNGPPRAGASPDFIGQYLNLTFVSQTANLCMISSALMETDVCGEDNVKLCVGRRCKETNGILATRNRENLLVQKGSDLSETLTSNKVLHEAKCITIRKSKSAPSATKQRTQKREETKFVSRGPKPSTAFDYAYAEILSFSLVSSFSDVGQGSSR